MNVRRLFLLGAAVVLCVLVTGRAQAQAIFLDIPSVQGEVVTPAAFANQIEVLSVSYGSASTTCNGHLSLSDLSLMKQTDRASVDFAAALRDHTVYPTATLRFTNAAGQVYQSYTLSNAVLTSLQMSGSTGGGRTTESVSFTFSQIAVMYQYFDGSGKANGPPETMTFTNTACP